MTALLAWFSLGCKVIVAIGLDQVVLGECRELRGTVAGDAKEYEKCPVLIEAKKTGRSASGVKKAVKKVGNSRQRAEKRLARWERRRRSVVRLGWRRG